MDSATRISTNEMQLYRKPSASHKNVIYNFLYTKENTWIHITQDYCTVVYTLCSIGAIPEGGVGGEGTVGNYAEYLDQNK